MSGLSRETAITAQNVCRFGLRAACSACIKGSCEAPDETTVRRVAEWIQDNTRQLKSIRRRTGRGGPSTSYGWKHLAQRVLGIYVSNGDFIAAALRTGVRAVPVAERNPNAFFAMALISRSSCATGAAR